VGFYDNKYYRSIDKGSLSSARRIVPLIQAAVSDISSVLDLGAGRGSWLSVWQSSGVSDVMAVDAGEFPEEEALVDPQRVVHASVVEPLDLGRRFDLAECLEVGEHVPTGLSQVLVANLVAHADVVLFSAGSPGQGGVGHINEQLLDFWVDLFKVRGYRSYDAVRPRVVGDRDVEPWYRFNAVLFANDAGAARLSADARQSRFPDSGNFHAFDSATWRLRKAVLSRLPVGTVTGIALAKHSLRRRLLGR
jgi:hypothetical protein